MMVDGYFLHVKGSIEEKFRQKDNWDLRVTVMSLLSEMRDKLTKSLTVCLDVKALNNQLLDSLMQVITTNNEKYPAKSCTLKFKIRDGEEAMYVDLLSKSHKVSPSDELMADIFSLTNTHAVLM